MQKKLLGIWQWCGRSFYLGIKLLVLRRGGPLYICKANSKELIQREKGYILVIILDKSGY
jgi:hypothetical protein